MITNRFYDCFGGNPIALLLRKNSEANEGKSFQAMRLLTARTSSLLGHRLCLGSLTMRARYQSAASADVDCPDRSKIWSLWNEGNLFSLSAPQLAAYLTTHCSGVTVDPKAKKSALVRQIEEILSSEQSSTIVPQEDTLGTAATIAVTDNDRGSDFFDDSDVYGDWGAEPGYEDRRDIDFMELSPSKMGHHYEALSPRAFQLLHENVTADLGLASFNPSKLPGQKKNTTAFVPINVAAADANRNRFRRGLQWCMLNLWNMNMPGEINIGAGKVLYWRDVAKHNRNVLPLWTIQQHLYNAHPYCWFAVAPNTAGNSAEAFAAKMGMSMSQDATTSYKVSIRKGLEIMDCEMNSLLRCTMLNRPWDRFLVTHYIRNAMPDLRLVVRARHGIKKRQADMYLDADILRSTRDSVQSVLSPELGDVIYCAERVIRKWSSPIMETQQDGTQRPTGLNLLLVETKRTPLITTKIGDEGTRFEYELIVSLPQQSDRVDTAQLGDTLWEAGRQFAEFFEPVMGELNAITMPTSASFEPLGNPSAGTA